MSANEPLVLNLERGEGVAHLAASGGTLAIGIGYHKPIESGMSAADAMKFKACIMLLRDGEPQIRTPFKPGSMRSLVVTPSGFIAALVKYGDDSRAITDFFEIDLKGTITQLPPLPIDLAGLWASENGAVFAYGARSVFRWSAVKPIWEKVPIDPAVNADAIRQIITLKNGSSLVVTDRSIRGFETLDKPPLFVDDLKTYPEIARAYGDDQWWIVTTSNDAQELSRIGPAGQAQEIASLGHVVVKDVLFQGNQLFIVCSGRWDNAHKAFYFTLDRDHTGSLRGPFALPNDTMSACVWKGSIVTGNSAASRVLETAIEP